MGRSVLTEICGVEEGKVEEKSKSGFPGRITVGTKRKAGGETDRHQLRVRTILKSREREVDVFEHGG